MKKKFSDFHLHTEFSSDSKEKLENVCCSAIAMGLSEIAITNHFDHDGIEEGIYEDYLFEKDLEDIFKAKEKFGGKIKIYAGLEIGQPHVLSDKNLSKIESLGYEFIIGSLHNLKNCFDFYFLDYKKTDSYYDRGIYKKYTRELLEIAECGFINTIGHITYPERYMCECGKSFVYSEFEDDFSLIFEKLAKNKIALEINTSGLRQGLGHTMPKVDILSLYKSCGGEYVTIGSDAHKACDVGKGIAETFEAVEKLGITHINEIKNKFRGDEKNENKKG